MHTGRWDDVSVIAAEDTNETYEGVAIATRILRAVSHFGTGPNVCFHTCTCEFVEHCVPRLLPWRMKGTQIEFGAGYASLNTALILDSSFDCLDDIKHTYAIEAADQFVPASRAGG